ncbi:hypothetical protein [Macrococcoides caseolyticum]|uniref:hypothetical protein n=1 Tax=Macrococcoides caseolyticum TaxID=69966 RepID=UPI0012FEFF5A|nr:hypothetical protein [Macrococcus caseolyticus]
MNNQYPIGQYEVPTNISNSDVSRWIADITSFPDQLKSILQNISDDQLSNQYREGSWDVRTLVHHMVISERNLS